MALANPKYSALKELYDLKRIRGKSENFWWMFSNENLRTRIFFKPNKHRYLNRDWFFLFPIQSHSFSILPIFVKTIALNSVFPRTRLWKFFCSKSSFELVCTWHSLKSRIELSRWAKPKLTNFQSFKIKNNLEYDYLDIPDFFEIF